MTYVISVRKGYTSKDGETSYEVLINKKHHGRKGWTVKYSGGEYAEVIDWEQDHWDKGSYIDSYAMSMEDTDTHGEQRFAPNNSASIREAMEGLCKYTFEG